MQHYSKCIIHQHCSMFYYFMAVLCGVAMFFSFVILIFCVCVRAYYLYSGNSIEYIGKLPMPVLNANIFYKLHAMPL